MTWFIIRFHPGAPLGVPAVASGPWSDRDLGHKQMADWRSAPEVVEIVEQSECPDLPADCLWTHTAAYEAAISLSFKRSPQPAAPSPADPALFSVRLTTEQRDLIRSAAARANLGTSAWARRVLLAAAAEPVSPPVPRRPKLARPAPHRPPTPRPVPPPPPPPVPAPAIVAPISDPAALVLEGLGSPPLTQDDVETALEEMRLDGLVQVVREPGQPPVWSLTEAGRAVAAIDELREAGLIEPRPQVEVAPPPAPPPPVVAAPASAVPDAPPAPRVHPQKGDRMRLSAYGLRSLASRTHTPLLRGTLVGYSRDGTSMRIQRDDVLGVQNYHHTFWEVDDAQAAELEAAKPEHIPAAPPSPPATPVSPRRMKQATKRPVSPITSASSSLIEPPLRIRRLPDPGAPTPSEPTAETIFTF